MRSVASVIATVLVLASSLGRADTPKPIDQCGAAALNLGAASPVATWKPPAGCRAKSNSIVLHTQAALDAQFDCPKGTVVAVDLANYALLQLTQNMQPAAIGIDAFDDGKSLTLVTRFRNRCPKDASTPQRLMTVWFLLPSTHRLLDRASCIVEMKCP